MSDPTRLRILLIGASGELGRAIVAELGGRHEILTSGSKSGDIRIDIGQVNLTLAARDALRDGGSITLIAGVLSEHPIVAGSSASMVNGAIEAFARAASVELPRGLRVNAVSPTVFEESMGGYAPFFRGFDPVPVARAARAFARSIEGRQTGQVYKVV